MSFFAKIALLIWIRLTYSKDQKAKSKEVDLERCITQEHASKLAHVQPFGKRFCCPCSRISEICRQFCKSWDGPLKVYQKQANSPTPSPEEYLDEECVYLEYEHERRNQEQGVKAEDKVSSAEQYSGLVQHMTCHRPDNNLEDKHEDDIPLQTVQWRTADDAVSRMSVIAGKGGIVYMEGVEPANFQSAWAARLGW